MASDPELQMPDRDESGRYVGAAIERYLANLVDVVEGPRYTNYPEDRGGPTKYGVTQKALAHHRGHPVTPEDVENLPRDEALEIYRQEYVVLPGFDKLADASPAVALECIDTGINMGQKVSGTMLQRSLNVLNNSAKLWPDLVTDGQCGPATITAVQSLLRIRGAVGQRMLLLVLNCLQGSRYVDIAEADPEQEKFVFGWFNQRIELVPDAVFYGAT